MSCGGHNSPQACWGLPLKLYIHLYRIMIWALNGMHRNGARTLRNTGVDFADAALIFAHPVLEAEDDRQDYGEVRLRALGHVGEEYYLVVYTWRGEDSRMINAR